MQERGNRREVRSPVLAFPSARHLQALPPEVRQVVIYYLGEMAADARTRAQQSWIKNKRPMAAYWKAVGAYAEHFRRVVRPNAQPVCYR